MFQAIVLVLAGSLACKPNSVSGELDGDSPGVLEAVFVENTTEAGEGVQVWLADFEDACNKLAAHREAVSEAQARLLMAESDDAFLAGAEQMEAADALLPEEFWVGKLQLNPGADGISDVELEGISAGAEPTDGFIARFSHQLGYTDWSTCAEVWLSDPSGVDVCDYQWRSWDSDGGTARVVDYVAGSELLAEFSAPFQELDVWTGDPLGTAGELDVRFAADWCAALEEAPTR